MLCHWNRNAPGQHFVLVLPFIGKIWSWWNVWWYKWWMSWECTMIICSKRKHHNNIVNDNCFSSCSVSKKVEKNVPGPGRGSICAVSMKRSATWNTVPDVVEAGRPVTGMLLARQQHGPSHLKWWSRLTENIIVGLLSIMASISVALSIFSLHARVTRLCFFPRSHGYRGMCVCSQACVWEGVFQAHTCEGGFFLLAHACVRVCELVGDLCSICWKRGAIRKIAHDIEVYSQCPF